MYPETYSIEVSTDDGMTWLSLIDDNQGLDYELNELEFGIPYQFRVQAHNSLGSSEATNPVKFVRGKKYKFCMSKMVTAMHR